MFVPYRPRRAPARVLHPCPGPPGRRTRRRGPVEVDGEDVVEHEQRREVGPSRCRFRSRLRPPRCNGVGSRAGITGTVSRIQSVAGPGTPNTPTAKRCSTPWVEGRRSPISVTAGAGVRPGRAVYALCGTPGAAGRSIPPTRMQEGRFDRAVRRELVWPRPAGFGPSARDGRARARTRRGSSGTGRSKSSVRRAGASTAAASATPRRSCEEGARPAVQRIGRPWSRATPSGAGAVSSTGSNSASGYRTTAGRRHGGTSGPRPEPPTSGRRSAYDARMASWRRGARLARGTPRRRGRRPPPAPRTM